ARLKPEHKVNVKTQRPHRAGFDLVPGINCPSVPHKSGLSCRESRTTLMLGISWGLPRSGNLMTGRLDYQGVGVNPLIRAPFSGIKEITERTGERKINEAYRSHPDKMPG
ncbi:hypothetical protein, partial [Buttiauxella sp. S19-1]|uniref:hypothetical protein n=1 Tax=Buttiauxella sp. S19-1 TaxID=941430 RepID=UPI001EDA4CAD